MDYARLMITQFEGVQREQKYLSDLFDQQKVKWERAAKDHNEFCFSKANLIRSGEKGYALVELNEILECTCQIEERALAALERAEEDVKQQNEVEREALDCAKAAFKAVPRSSCSEYAELQAEIAAFI